MRQSGTQTWTLIVEVPDDLAPSDLQERIDEEEGVSVLEMHFENLLAEGTA